jgi:hypothetical protein
MVTAIRGKKRQREPQRKRPTKTSSHFFVIFLQIRKLNKAELIEPSKPIERSQNNQASRVKDNRASQVQYRLSQRNNSLDDSIQVVKAMVNAILILAAALDGGNSKLMVAALDEDHWKPLVAAHDRRTDSGAQIEAPLAANGRRPGGVEAQSAKPC